MQAEELTLPPVDGSIGQASWGRAEELALVVWIKEMAGGPAQLPPSPRALN